MFTLFTLAAVMGIVGALCDIDERVAVGHGLLSGIVVGLAMPEYFL